MQRERLPKLVYSALLFFFLRPVEANNDFNEIKFTQIWGYTECLSYKESHEEELTCRYEGVPSIFTIHGIWPTETGTYGPNFCEKIKFNETLLEPIEDELNHYWYEISPTKNPKKFWSHEWLKHGSCAKSLPMFSTELEYFREGLDLRKKYDLYTVLKEGGIIPENSEGKGYSISAIVQAFREAFGVSPYVQCFHSKSGDVYLLAVEVCLDRNLKPLDCSTHDTRHLDRESVLPCPPDHQILYQDNIRTVKREL